MTMMPSVTSSKKEVASSAVARATDRTCVSLLAAKLDGVRISAIRITEPAKAVTVISEAATLNRKAKATAIFSSFVAVYSAGEPLAVMVTIALCFSTH